MQKLLTFWNQIPVAEQKVVLGAALAVLMSGAFTAAGNGHTGLMVDYGIAVIALQRYFTDVIQRFMDGRS